MSFKVCSKCGKKYNDDVTFCPSCGTKIENKDPKANRNATIVWVCLGILLIIGLNVGSDNSNSDSKSSANSINSSKIYREGETVQIGYTSYEVRDSWWSRRLSDNKYANEYPDAMYLFVKLAVRNDDNEARSIPPFKLFDENSAEYERASRSWAVDNAIGLLDSLNPGVAKLGVIVFDVPQYHDYKLRVSGGYWSGEEAYIKLSPS